MLLVVLAFGANLVFAQSPVAVARQHYNTTRYEEAIRALQDDSSLPARLLTGQSWFMLGEFKKATETFEKALALNPNSAELHLWAGRAYGRRAETSMALTAPRLATKSRDHFEKSVQIDPGNVAALADLFEYYLQAPGFLGGGKDKAARIAQEIAKVDPSEGYYASARLAEERKEFSAAEQQLRQAAAVAPNQVGRVLDLAKLLYKQGRVKEGEAEFAKAEKMAPNSPKVLFAKAAAYIQAKRNLDQAKLLLKKYLQSPLTPDDPTREEAEKLLKTVGL
ncbi:MAG: tetratricopeptide repeat protein [Acidobacteria bacterium]|nr:tetratricopeptide repeat protein [Acidobacteriota bacterium]